MQRADPAVLREERTAIPGERSAQNDAAPLPLTCPHETLAKGSVESTHKVPTHYSTTRGGIAPLEALLGPWSMAWSQETCPKRHVPQESAPAIGKRLRSTIQWVGTTSRAPTGGRVPSWGNLITLLDYEPVCHAAFASLGGLKNRRGFSRKHLRKGQLCRLYARKTRHCHSFAKPPKFYSIFLLISGRANSPHLGPLFPFQGEPIHHNY